MALQHLRSSTANKRPTPAAMSDGQLAMNTNLASPGLFLKDSNGDLVKVGPVHVGTTAPNTTPASGGQAGNSKGEQWLDTSSSRYVFKIWDGTDWRTEDGEFVNSSGDTMTGALVMDNQQQVRFRETTANGTNFIAIEAPASVTADRTLTLPDVTGTIVSTGDTGTVTSTMILDGTILNADVNASAAIAGTKISPDFGSQTIATTGVFSHALGAVGTPSITFTGDLNTGIYSPGADQVAVATNGTQRLTVDTAATTSTLPVVHPLGAVGTPSLTFTGDLNTGIWSPAADTIAFSEGGVEAMRIDSSARVGIGTSSPGALLDLAGDNTGLTSPLNANNRLRFTDTDTTQTNGQPTGTIEWYTSDTDSPGVHAYISTDMFNSGTGALVIGTGSGGSASERMRIDSDGTILFSKTSANFANAGVDILNSGQLRTTRSGAAPIAVNRLTNDGNLVEFYQAGTLEGVISVSGTTVTYGGGHLARWSQLLNNEDPTDLLKGTVMSNLDEMCEWGEEDNEQLNKTKVSDVEGDPNVAGVFVSTSFSDDGPLDFFVAMTGDMVIRIAEGVTVERGDLLMSAGDGTAKPQGDGYVQDKTIAKVTSTNVSCTYEDGSYCVPCVLMAC